MSLEVNRETTRRVFEEFFTAGKVDLADELFSPKLVQHHPDAPYETRGPDGIQERIRGYRTAFPDLETPILDLVAQEDRVAIRYIARGANSGEIMGMPATGKSIKLEAQAIYRFEDGKVVEIWDAWNVLALMEQLGLANQTA